MRSTSTGGPRSLLVRRNPFFFFFRTGIDGETGLISFHWFVKRKTEHKLVCAEEGDWGEDPKGFKGLRKCLIWIGIFVGSDDGGSEGERGRRR